MRRGDGSDPLAGVVRVGRTAAQPLHLVLPRGAWVRGVVDRAQRSGVGVELAGTRLPVVEAADLVLLEPYAGGFFDQRDVLALLEIGDRDAIVASVDDHVQDLPTDARRLWARLAIER